ncbi:hypothetical protein GQ457_12G015730 [Hibiscus cannabinus]
MGCLCSVFDVKKQGKPIWEVRTRNWKIREGENRLSGLLEGIPIASLGKARRQGGPRYALFGERVRLLWGGYRYPSSPWGLEYRYWLLSTDTSCLKTVFGNP